MHLPLLLLFAAASLRAQSTAQQNYSVDLAGGLPAAVSLSAPVSPGMWQINALLPAGLTGQVPLFVIAGNSVSTVAVQ